MKKYARSFILDPHAGVKSLMDVFLRLCERPGTDVEI